MKLLLPFIPAAVVIRFERREMRGSRWRFRLRTLMAVVALVALVLASWLEPRRREYRMWARFHADQERLFSRPIVGNPSAAAVHAAIKNRYLDAATCPWVTVTPDPRYADIHPGGVNYKISKVQIERFR
jgi:hypothetical protein